MLTDINTALAQRIRLLRVRRGLSQFALAEIAGIHYNFLGHIERAEQDIRINSLYKIAKALDISVSELMQGI